MFPVVFVLKCYLNAIQKIIKIIETKLRSTIMCIYMCACVSVCMYMCVYAFIHAYSSVNTHMYNAYIISQCVLQTCQDMSMFRHRNLTCFVISLNLQKVYDFFFFFSFSVLDQLTLFIVLFANESFLMRQTAINTKEIHMFMQKKNRG